MKKVILHIGAGKTGSSALQVGFAKNIERLRDYGVHYPPNKYVDMALSDQPTPGNGLGMASFLSPELQTDLDYRQPIFELIEHHSSNEISTILFSSEKLSALKPDRLRLLRKLCESLDYQLVVVLYVRSITDHAFAQYVQRVRVLYTESFQNFLQGIWSFPFRKIIENVDAGLDPTSLIVKSYDALKSDLFIDFARTVLNLSEEQIETLECPKTINRSYSRDEVQIMREFNHFFVDQKQALRFSNAYIDKLKTTSRLALWQDEIDIVSRKSAEDEPYVSARLGEQLPLYSSNADVFTGSEPPIDERTRTLIAGLMVYNQMRAAPSKSK